MSAKSVCACVFVRVFVCVSVVQVAKEGVRVALSNIYCSTQSELPYVRVPTNPFPLPQSHHDITLSLWTKTTQIVGHSVLLVGRKPANTCHN